MGEDGTETKRGRAEMEISAGTGGELVIGIFSVPVQVCY